MADVERPNPDIVGSGTANYAAQIAEARRKQKEAAVADDWGKADQYEAQIRQLEQKRAEAVRNGGK